MKEIFIYIDDEGYFTCNTGITVDMWKTFLRDGKLMTPDRIDMLVKFYNEPDHKSTCRTLAEKYDNETVICPSEVQLPQYPFRPSTLQTTRYGCKAPQ